MQVHFEEQLLNGLALLLRRPETLEYIVTSFQKQLQQRRDQEKRASNEIEMRQERTRLESQKNNLVAAIADSGHSQALLAKLSAVELELDRLTHTLDNRPPAQRLTLSGEKLRAFVLRKLSDVESLLTSDPESTRLYLAKHVNQIVLTPLLPKLGTVLEATGDVHLFSSSDPSISMALSGILLDPKLGTPTRTSDATSCVASNS